MQHGKVTSVRVTKAVDETKLRVGGRVIARRRRDRLKREPQAKLIEARHHGDFCLRFRDHQEQTNPDSKKRVDPHHNFSH